MNLPILIEAYLASQARMGATEPALRNNRAILMDFCDFNRVSRGEIMNVQEVFKKEIKQVAHAIERRIEIRNVRKGMYAGAATLKELDPGRVEEYSRIIQILDGTKPEDEGD